MDRERRLRKRSDFLAVQHRGTWWSNKLLGIRVLANEAGRSRFGFLVSKRVGKAVVRNRVKRRLREIARKEPIQEGWDIVMIARSGLAAATFAETAEAARDLLKRSRLLE